MKNKSAGKVSIPSIPLQTSSTNIQFINSLLNLMLSETLNSYIEWNTKIISTEQGEVASEIVKEFNSFWKSEYALDFETFYEIYKARYEIIKHQREEAKKDRIPSFEKYKLKPNSMQSYSCFPSPTIPMETELLNTRSKDFLACLANCAR